MPATIENRADEFERENAALRRELAACHAELAQARAQQAATAEVLQVINSSPGDLAPVFDAMLDKALRLCEANLGHVLTYDGERFAAVATRGNPQFDKWLRGIGAFLPEPGSTSERFVQGESIIEIRDLADDAASKPANPIRRALIEIGGFRTSLSVALRKEGSLLGVLHIHRQEIRPFSEKQIALLQNFAAQAVIAMENARLINETRQALAQQTATAEVLQVINSSPGDLAPVFEAMLHKAHTLCEASFGALMTYDGERFHAVAHQGTPALFREFLAAGIRPGSGDPFARMVEGSALSHIDDLSEIAAEHPDEALPRAAVDLGGIRTLLVVPLRKDNALLGVITAYRQEVRPFTDKQIALLQNFAAQAVIAMENARLLTETREALEQQTATAEVLQVINSSPGDLAPVFDTVVDTAARLCGTNMAGLAIRVGDTYRYVATRSLNPEWDAYVTGFSFQPERGTATGRTLLERRIIHIADLAADPEHTVPEIVSVGGIRTFLGVPLLREGEPIGVLALARQKAEPFTEQQIALVDTFAAQAVIAMENARLITETREALEQQTATAEVLQVINSSPGDLAPVFDAILEKAHTLCDAEKGTLNTYDGEHFLAVASHGLSQEYVAMLRAPQSKPSGSPPDRLLHGERIVQVPDARVSPFPIPQAAAAIESVRTILYVPLRKDGNLAGYITVYRQEVRPFTEQQVALLENFAAQAVIAMENARLLTETREALEQQTATAEVLQVINSSPGDLAPVFEAMLEKALRLCEAAFGTLVSFSGERFQTVAQQGLPAPYAEYLTTTADQPGPGGGQQRVLRGERVVHFADMKDDEAYRSGRNPAHRAMVDLGGARTGLVVPLRKDETVVGTFTLYRQEVRPFSGRQIALLQNFAAQAVIAMENARLLTETREALEQQTATAEVLQVINSSPGDLAPVFDAMLEKALTLCEAACGQLATFDGEAFEFVAVKGDRGWLEGHPRGRLPASRGLTWVRIVSGEPYVHILDARDTDAYRSGQEGARDTLITGGRTYLTIALRREQALLGALTVYRKEVRPFSEKQIALLQNFAAQAVIAMENARLLTETREALAQQTATAEVLQVINASPGDLAPVFEAMLEKATRLCGASLGTLWAYDGERMHPLAMRGVSPEYAEYLSDQPLRPGAGALGSFVRGETILHVVDLKNTDAYQNGDTHRKALVDLGGGRSLLGVPLRTDDQLRGGFLIYRREPLPFSDKQIALLQNFAAQAVIAMENARLLTETREALDQQTATAEVLGVINASPGDLAPVFDAMLEKAMALCEAAFGGLWTFDRDRYVATALRGVPDEYARFLAQTTLLPGPGSAPYRFLHGERAVIQNLDLAGEAPYQAGDPQRRALVDLGGARTALQAPLVKDDVVLGVITVYRRQVRPFTDKQIALLQNFAAQAVIAIENARLINETREALAQQTATAEVLQVINASPGNLTPVFDAMLEKATRLCEAPFGTLRTWDGERFHVGAVYGKPRFIDWVRERGSFRPDRDGSPLGRIIDGEQIVHFGDAPEEAGYIASRGFREMVEISGMRSGAAVSLRKDNALLGTITIYRQEVRPFTDKQIALLQNFAAQAVIAMENARLLTETREALEYQTATSDVLKVISGSVFELQPVLQTVVETAVRLCRADQAVIYRRYDGEYRWAAGHSLLPEYEAIEREARIRPGAGTLVGRAAVERGTVHILDAWTDPLYEVKDDARTGGIHTMLGVPLLREGTAIGVIGLARRRIEAYSEKEVALVTTFADQAVIAIENARLFDELRARTADLQESLEYQTATSDVLKVISQSTFDLQPVLDTLVETAARLCAADFGALSAREGQLYRVRASAALVPEFDRYLRGRTFGPGRDSVTGRAALERGVVHIADCTADPEFAVSEAVTIGRLRTMLGVPLLRESEPVGVLVLSRQRVEPFSDRQIDLVRTFADQAVIAIENARLFNELRARTAELGRSVDELRVLNEVAQAVSSTLDLRTVLTTTLTRSVALAGADSGAVFRYSRAEREFRLVDGFGWSEEFSRKVADLRVGESETAMGEAAAQRAPMQIPDLALRPSAPLRDAALAEGLRGVLIVPLVGPERILGAMVLQRRGAGEFPPETVRLMQTLASQSVLAIQNARLFREIAEKSEELALASQHKSQFLANMSHELRTPLNAILGYAELLVDGIYGALPEKAQGVLERVQNNGKHLLALINDVLDLAKIEAGQLTLTIENYSLPELVNTVVVATEPLASAKGLKFTTSVADGLPMGRGDARRLAQVLLNLVGNAIKFTDAGEVAIGAACERGQFVLTVRDTGPGIADADQDRIFGEFQQIDNADTRKKGGTGLGLAISKRMVEMQGGMITLASALGQGSTFRVVLPVEVEPGLEAMAE